MADAWIALARGVLLGLGAAAPIGPVNVQIARLTLKHGFRSGFLLGCGAVTVDVIYASLSGLGLTWLAGNDEILRFLTIGGIALLTWLGIQSLRGERFAWRSQFTLDSPGQGMTPHRAYLTGLLMTFFNPMTLGFWFVAVPAAGGTGVGESELLPFICAGVLLGTLGWVVFFAGILSRLRNRRPGWLLAGADLVGGLTLLFTAATILWRSLLASL